MTSKQWGKRQFWGLGSEFDPDWVYNEEQIALRDKLIEICRTKIRPTAIRCDKTYEYPRESVKALAELNILGLIIPKEYGGLEESNTCMMMVLETIARYGCPSTGLILTMHYSALSYLLFRYHNSDEIQDLLRRVCKEGLIGTAAFTDPASGGHLWYPISSKCQKVDEDHYKFAKHIAWSTGAGFADWYIQQCPNPDSDLNYSDIICYYVFKNEIRSPLNEWSSLGMHGNQSGPMLFDGILPKSRIVGEKGEGALMNDEVGYTTFNICTSAVWNGIAIGCIDLVKKYATQKTHGGGGYRVADYPVIQDYVGKCLCETNCNRGFLCSLVEEIDRATNNNDWSLYENPNAVPKLAYRNWLLQAKYCSSINVNKVADQMFRACGGEGFRTDLGIERLLRDSKAALVMAPGNEYIKSIFGKAALGDSEALFDKWNITCNKATIRNDINLMTLEEKKALFKVIAEDIENEEKILVQDPYQDTDFENPFNTSPPKHIQTISLKNGVHPAALNPSSWTALKLISKTELNDTTSSYVFEFPDAAAHLGCLPGQYIQLRVAADGEYHERYFSPVTPPDQFGSVELVIKFEANGIVSNILKDMQIGSNVEFQGPCGGFEYEPNQLEELIIIAAGSGVTPGIQLIRCISLNPKDKVKVTLIYYAKDVEELIYHQELERIAKTDSRIQLILTVGEAPEYWENEDGFVDMLMLQKYITKSNGTKQKILMCGGASMAISCLHSLRSLNFPSETTYVYGQFGTQQLKAVYGRCAKLSSHKA